MLQYSIVVLLACQIWIGVHKFEPTLKLLLLIVVLEALRSIVSCHPPLSEKSYPFSVTFLPLTVTMCELESTETPATLIVEGSFKTVPAATPT